MDLYLEDHQPYLSLRAARELHKLSHDAEEVQELLVLISEALSKHQAADHIRHGAAQQDRGVERRSWRRGGKHSWTHLKVLIRRKKSAVGEIRKSTENMFYTNAIQMFFKRQKQSGV